MLAEASQAGGEREQKEVESQGQQIPAPQAESVPGEACALIPTQSVERARACGRGGRVGDRWAETTSRSVPHPQGTGVQ